MSKIKTRVILDCDQVLAEFVDHLIKAIAKIEDPPDPATFTTWDIIKNHMTPSQQAATKSILAGTEFWETQPVIPGAKFAVDSLVDMGFEIHVATNAWSGCKTWAGVREYWLKHNLGIESKFVHNVGHKYLVSGNVFVDDKPEHIQAWQADQNHHGHPERVAFLFAYDFNESFEWPNRLYGWTPHNIRTLSVAASHAQSGKS